MKEQKEKDKSVEAFSILISVLIILGVCISDNAAEISCAAASLMFRGETEAITESETSETVTAAVTEITTTEKAENAVEINLLEVPEDIVKVIKKYSQLGKDDEKGNNIRSVTYGEKGSTDIFKNIRVRNITETKSINIESVLGSELNLSIDKSKPAVLIFHSHTSEAYELFERSWFAEGDTSRSNDENLNVVRVGTEITNYLEKFGYTVIHDKTIHDDSYNDSYPHSRKTIDKILKDNPQIKIVIDIHRDSIDLDSGEKIKPVSVIEGKKAAQIMIITGAEEGKITDFPDWEYNLKFAVKLQKKCEDMYPGLTRPLLFTQKKYNMDVTHFSLLIEMGSEANTLDEACYSGRLLASVLASFMDDYKE